MPPGFTAGQGQDAGGGIRYDLALRSRRVVLPDAERAATVVVAGGRIAGVYDWAALDRPGDVTAAEVHDLGSDALLPGLVDTHVNTGTGLDAATLAAASGGVTTLVGMPPGRGRANGQFHVDVGFWGGVGRDNLGELRAMHRAGVVGFVCSLADSAEWASTAALAEMLATVAAFDGLVAVQAEDRVTLAAAPAPTGSSYADFMAGRPDAAETRAIARLLDLVAVTGARVHLLQLSSALALPRIAIARRAGLPVTVETCPHYLTLCAEEIPAGATQFKTRPPVRAALNRGWLWQGLADGTIDCIASAHSPAESSASPVADFAVAAEGIASVAIGLPLVWTEARVRGHGLMDVVRWMASTPAAVVGLAGKGRIEVGYDADLVAFAADAEQVVDARPAGDADRIGPYAGRRLTGVVRATWLRGRRVVGPDGDPDGGGRHLAAR